MVSGSLPHLEEAFGRVGWFIPPYAQNGFLSFLAAEIRRDGSSFSQEDLERRLALLYGPVGLAAMVCSRYPITPVILDYKETISEAIEAHFLGLHHVAVGGLIPVIEGAGRELLRQRGLSAKGARNTFAALAQDCKCESFQKRIGAPEEVASMMDAFCSFTENVLYASSDAFQFLDGTNRHGISHGTFADCDYGRPLNFYKTIGAVDFLCFVSAFRASISWFAPEPTAQSNDLASYYLGLQAIGRGRTRR